MCVTLGSWTVDPHGITAAFPDADLEIDLEAARCATDPASGRAGPRAVMPVLVLDVDERRMKARMQSGRRIDFLTEAELRKTLAEHRRELAMLRHPSLRQM